MSKFFKLLDQKYCVTDYAKNTQSFSKIISGVYLWYPAIDLKYKKRDIVSTFKFFYENDYLKYSTLNEILVEDNIKKTRSIFLNTQVENPTKGNSSDLFNSKDELFTGAVADLFLSFSTLNRPIYIGKSSPKNMESDRDLSDRIKEHLKLKSDFGRAIKNINEDFELRDLIVKAIDIGKIEEDFFDLNFNKNKEDFSALVESHLIRILKPSFNIKY